MHGNVDKNNTGVLYIICAWAASQFHSDSSDFLSCLSLISDLTAAFLGVRRFQLFSECTRITTINSNIPSSSQYKKTKCHFSSLFIQLPLQWGAQHCYVPHPMQGRYIALHSFSKTLKDQCQEKKIIIINYFVLYLLVFQVTVTKVMAILIFRTGILVEHLWMISCMGHSCHIPQTCRAAWQLSTNLSVTLCRNL